MNITEEFEEFIKTLLEGAQQNIRDSMKRGESVTYDAFKAGKTAGCEQYQVWKSISKECTEYLWSTEDMDELR